MHQSRSEDKFLVLDGGKESPRESFKPIDKDIDLLPREEGESLINTDLWAARYKRSWCPRCLRVCTRVCRWRRGNVNGKSFVKRSKKSVPTQQVKQEIRRDVETGYFSKTRDRKYDLTLQVIRRNSYAVLRRQHFDRHTAINSEGYLIKQKSKQFWGLEPISEESEVDEITGENPLDTLNYILQIKLDEVIAVPSRPVDGYNEALIELTRVSTSAPHKKVSDRPGKRYGSWSSSSLSSIPSKITDQRDLKPVEPQTNGIEPNLSRNLFRMRTPLILALLPTLSREVHHELTHDYEYNYRYSKILEELFLRKGRKKMDKRKLKKTFTSERWLAVIYIDYRRKKPIEAFRRLVVKLILHKYLVAFEEKDLSKEAITVEFANRLGHFSRDYDVPFVFTNGIPIGGCSMIYYLHNVELMDKFFKHSIMDPDKYQRWLHNPIENIVREQLLLKVPLATFPMVSDVMKGTVKEYSQEVPVQTLESFLLEGAFLVNEAQRKWNEILRETKYAEPKLLPYALLKATILHVLESMEAQLVYYDKRESKAMHCCGLI